MSIPYQKVPLGLPKKVGSLCPKCQKVIPATILKREGKVVMEKTCPEHGFFDDLVYSDVNLYLKVEKWTFEDGPGLSYPTITDAKRCPEDCGMCQMHLSRACVTNIDLTNRCNLRCPICFANANAQGYVYELTYEQAVKCLENIKKVNYPQEHHVVQFSGGEPTLHPDFLKILKASKDMDFSSQIASNGKTIAASLEFAQACKENGLRCVYLQFDGLTEDVYRQARGAPLLETKLKVIEHCRKANIDVVLVPTVVKTINDNQVGEILKFALENNDVVVGIAYQPVCFTGRISTQERKRYRYTLSDLAWDVEKQTGILKTYEDWYPLGMSQPLSRLFSALRGIRYINVTCHSNCGLGTYLVNNIADRTIKPVAVSQFLDIEGLMTDSWHLVKKIEKKGKLSSINKGIISLQFLNLLRRHFRKEKAPKGLTVTTLVQMIDRLLGDKGKDSPWRFLLVAGMHFQDSWNYNLDRIKRCVIYYAAPDGRIYSFCTYNSGPTFRERVEKQFSVPLPVWLKKNGQPAEIRK